MSESFVLVETRGRVGLLTLNRPKALNALNDQLMNELGAALLAFEANADIGCVVITGSEKAFAAGADIGAMKDWSYMDVYGSEYITRNWETLKRIRKPVIAAVGGYALGGGCELAMHADILLAADTASFGQPEVLLGLMPGGGATQRLTRAVGKFKAMKLLLAGDRIPADQACAMGLVSEIVPDAELEAYALDLAGRLARGPRLAQQFIKEAVIESMNTSLAQGLAFERKSFQLLFDTEDKRRGIRARLEKTAAVFDR